MRSKSPLSRENFYRIVILAVLVLLFLFSLFSNLSHPLLWNDEGTTAVAGERILQYGYPKVHDGKNVLYDLNHPDYSIGIDEKTDAFIADANWAMYYVAALGARAARLTDDYYLKTALLRFPFALAGFTGLLLLAWHVSLFFREKKARLNFLIAFALFILYSVPLVLHLREVRYYSLVILFLSCAISLFTSFQIRHAISFRKYFAGMVPVLIGLFLSFPPLFFMFCIDAAVFVLTVHLFNLYRNRKTSLEQNQNRKLFFTALLKESLPYITALVVLYPAIRYFKLFEMANTLAEYYHFNFRRYQENLGTIFDYLSGYDFLAAAAVLKIILLFFRRKLIRAEKNIPLLRLSFFLSIVTIVHFFLIARIPTFLYIRYFIALTPLIACIIIIDITLLYSLLVEMKGERVAVFGCACIALTLIWPVTKNAPLIRDHCYEATHVNKGPLDFAVEFIGTKYPKTDSLIISTNYEEPVLMYYLESKVIVGYIKNNLAEDTLLQPDIVIYRKGWAWLNDENIFRDQLAKANYDSVIFPVMDYPVNTIAQIVTPEQGLGHQFRTLLTDDPAWRLKIYFRRQSAN